MVDNGTVTVDQEYGLTLERVEKVMAYSCAVDAKC